MAQLRLAGLLDDGGKMLTREDAEAAGHPLADRLVMRDDVRAFQLYGEVVLTQSDVRALQFAKGAISTGIETAMRAMGLTAEDLDEVMLAGSFGSLHQPAERPGRSGSSRPCRSTRSRRSATRRARARRWR